MYSFRLKFRVVRGYDDNGGFRFSLGVEVVLGRTVAGKGIVFRKVFFCLFVWI